MNTSKTYTKANISKDTLFWLFGVELGIIDCSISSLEELEKHVDEHYTVQQINDLVITVI